MTSKSNTPRNYGQITRKVKIKKLVPRSEHILNLSEEAKMWRELSKRLRKRIAKET